VALTTRTPPQWWTYRMRLHVCPICRDQLCPLGESRCGNCATGWDAAQNPETAPPVTMDLDTALRQAGIDPTQAAAHLQPG